MLPFGAGTQVAHLCKRLSRQLRVISSVSFSMPPQIHCYHSATARTALFACEMYANHSQSLLRHRAVPLFHSRCQWRPSETSVATSMETE